MRREYSQLKKELTRAEEEVMNVFEERTMKVGQYKDLREESRKGKGVKRELVKEK